MSPSAKPLQRLQTELDKARQRIASLERQLDQHPESSDKEIQVFRYLAQHGTEVIVLLNAESRVVYVSPTISQVMGYSVEEYRQFGLFDLIHPDDHFLAETEIVALRASPGGSRTLDVRSPHKDGRWLWMDVTASNQLQNPAIQAILITFRDITARKTSPAKPMAEQLQTLTRDLQNYQSQLKSILDTMQDGLLTVSLPDHKLIYASAAIEKIFGYSPQRFMDDPELFKRLVYPGDMPMIMDAMAKATAEGFAELEHRIVLPDGQVRWVFRRVWINYDEQGRPIRVNDTAQDVTARKNAEAALRTSEELYRSLVESSEAAITLVDSKGIYLYLNEVAAKSFGVPPEALIGKTIEELFPADQSGRALSHIKQVIEIGQGTMIDSEVTRETKKGWFRISIQPVRGGTGAVYAALVHASDITDKKLAEQAALRQNEILHQSRNLIALSDLDGTITYMNKGGSDLIGFTDPLQAIGRPTYDFYAPEDMARVRGEYLPKMFQTGQWQGENRLKKLSGQLIDVDQTIFSIRDQNNAIIEYATIMFDITERKAAEQALQQSENYLRSLMDSQTALNIRVDSRGSLTYCNQRYIDQFGWLAPSLIGLPALNAIYPDDRDKSMAVIGQCIAQPGIPIQAEARSLKQDGSYFWTYWELIAIRGSDGAVTEIQYVGFDISQQKQAEADLHALNERLEQRVRDRTAELEKSQEQLDAIFNHSGDGILLLDVKYGIQQANHVFESQFGLAADSYVGRKLRSFFNPDDAATIGTSIQAIVQSHETRRLNVRGNRVDGTSFDAEISLAPVNTVDQQVTSLVAVIRDVTERNKVEAALHASEERLRILFDTASDVICLLSFDGVFVDINSAGLRMTGLSREAIVGQHFSRLNLFANPVQMNKIATEGLRLTREGRRRVQEYALKGADGRLTIVEGITHPITINNEQLQLAIIRDVTARREAEAALRENEERYRTVITIMSEGIVFQSQDGAIRTSNAAAEHILGLTADQMMGRTSVDPSWRAIHEDGSPFPGDDHPAMITLRTGQPQSDVVMGVHKPDGTLTWIMINSRPVFYAGPLPDAVVSTFSDITHRLEIEKTLQKKLADEQELQWYLQSLHEITIDLTEISSLDEFYKRTVTMGIERLGFDRVAMFIYDAEHNMALGTYGTDQYGHLLAEHSTQFEISADGNMWKSLQKPARYHLLEQTPLVYDHVVVGSGWHVTVPLRYGDRPLGWLVADNLVNHKPTSLLQLEILGQYGVFIAASMVRRQVESALQTTTDQLEAILDHSTASIFMKDLDGQLLLFNQPPGVDLSVIERLGSANSTADVAANANNHDGHRSRSTAEVPSSYEASVDNRTFWVTNFPIFDDQDQIYATGGIATDITVRKLYEESLERALQKEKELGELKSRFVSMASHEFRTPLSVILSAAETLTAYRDRLNSTQIEVRLDKIRQQVMHMKDIMEDVLQLTRGQAGHLDYKPFRGNLDALCQEIVDEFHNQAEYRGRIIYTCANPPVFIDFDGRLMRQIISNIVSNALKYSPNEQSVFVDLAEVSSPDADESMVILKVRDQGIGIPPNDLPLLFEPFHRAANVGAISGTGLGLSIAKQAAEAHGGTLTVESQIKQGTTFIAQFPLQRNNATTG